MYKINSLSIIIEQPVDDPFESTNSENPACPRTPTALHHPPLDIDVLNRYIETSPPNTPASTILQLRTVANGSGENKKLAGTARDNIINILSKIISTPLDFANFILEKIHQNSQQEEHLALINTQNFIRNLYNYSDENTPKNLLNDSEDSLQPVSSHIKTGNHPHALITPPLKTISTSQEERTVNNDSGKKLLDIANDHIKNIISSISKLWTLAISKFLEFTDEILSRLRKPFKSEEQVQLIGLQKIKNYQTLDDSKDRKKSTAIDKKELFDNYFRYSMIDSKSSDKETQAAETPKKYANFIEQWKATRFYKPSKTDDSSNKKIKNHQALEDYKDRKKSTAIDKEELFDNYFYYSMIDSKSSDKETQAAEAPKKYANFIEQWKATRFYKPSKTDNSSNKQVNSD